MRLDDRPVFVIAVGGFVGEVLRETGLHVFFPDESLFDPLRGIQRDFGGVIDADADQTYQTLLCLPIYASVRLK